MGEFVRLEISEGIGTIRLDRPPMNALNIEVQDGLRGAAQAAADSDQVSAVVARAGPLSAAFDAVARIPKPIRLGAVPGAVGTQRRHPGGVAFRADQGERRTS